MKEYKHSCSTMEVLLWESEQAKPKPASYYNCPAQERATLALEGVMKKKKEFLQRVFGRR